MLQFDALVSGSGLVGAAMMASLQQLRQRSGEESSVSKLGMIDEAKRPIYDPVNMMHKLRTVSITPVSSKILDNLGGWERLTTKHSYYRIAVRHEQVNSPAQHSGSISRGPFFLSSCLGSTASREPLLEFVDLRKPVGFMCYNAELNSAMLDVVDSQATSTDTILFGASLDNIQLPPRDLIDGPLGKATLCREDNSNKSDASFQLLIGCEGRGSPLRDILSTPSVQHDYAQTAFVCDVRLEKVDDGNVCCFQNFFNDGMIIAMLPMSADTANIVFSTTPSHAKKLMGLSQQALVDELNTRLHAFAPNDIPKILEVPEGTINGTHRRAQGSFPLKLNFVTQPFAPRAVIMGDAAHGIHPFAGQGLNLGIYDVCAFTSVLEKAIRSGQDIGNPVSVGQAFAGEMVAHTAPMIGGMETIKHLLYGLPNLSCLGMKSLNTIPVLSTMGKDAIFHVSSGAAFAARHSDSFLLA